MTRIKLTNCFLMLIAALFLPACDQAKKPKPVSNDITKTTVRVAGKKDSVINNPQKNYGAATVADPCVKCLVQVIQQSKSYKDNTASISSQDINFTVNWVKASRPALKPDTSNITNGIRIDVKQIEEGEDKKLCSYVYDNANGSLFLLNKQDKPDHSISSITPEILKRIRNSCYWGVASGR